MSGSSEYKLGRTGGGSQVYLFDTEESSSQPIPGIMKRKACRLCWTFFTCAVTVSLAIFFASYFTGSLKATVTLPSCLPGCVCRDSGMWLYLVACEDLNMKHVPPGAIPPNATDISLERNLLHSLDVAVFATLERMRVLYLRQNAFTTVSEDTLSVFKDHPKLEALDLSENSWDCSCSPDFKNFVAWLVETKGPRPRGDPVPWISLVNAHKTVCHQPERLKNTRLDALQVKDICP